MRTRTIAAAILAGLVLAAPAAAQNRTITYGSWAPESGPGAVAAKAFFERVTRLTNGSLQFRTHWDGTVVNIRTTLPGVRDGLVDAAYVTGSLFGREWPMDDNLRDEATIQGDVRVLTAAFTETMLLNCPQCRQDVARTETIALGYMTEAPFYLMCARPFERIEELRGRQIRGVGSFALFAQHLGAVPVTTAPGETFEAMQRGAVSCAIGGGFWLRQFSMWDVAKHVVDRRLGQYNNGSLMTINRDVWRGMTAQQRQVFRDNLPFLMREAARANIEQDREVREQSRSRNVNWVQPSAEFEASFQAYKATERPRVLRQATERRIANADQVWTALDRNIEKWTRIVTEIGDNWDAYEEALRREIYARFDPDR